MYYTISPNPRDRNPDDKTTATTELKKASIQTPVLNWPEKIISG
jgi:hypothetical protein